MSELAAWLHEIIAQEGPIPVDRFMALALGHYYATRDPFGSGGDFVTAPEISQMFGELIGLWAADAWLRQGAPVPVALVELGPGRGTLMADALRAVRAALPPFAAALEVHLVETSPILRARQAERLGAFAPRWHDSVETLPDLPTIVIANEFFDALPVRQFLRSGGRWLERLVGSDGERLIFGLAPQPSPDGPRGSAPEGTIVERGEVGASLFATLAAGVKRRGGAILAIDYGSLEAGTGDTLQALAGHRVVAPLDRVGEADLTCHVDFSALATIARHEGLLIDVLGIQGDFLDALGIAARAERLKRQATPDQVRAIDAALSRLTDRSTTGMGTLFKVLAASRPPVDG